MLTRALALLVFLTVATAHATDIIVPDDFPTIQAAVNAAANNDTVMVRAGTYAETVVVVKDGLTLVGVDGIPTLTPALNKDGIVQRGPDNFMFLTNFAIVGGVTAVKCADCYLNNVHISNSQRGYRGSRGGEVVGSTFTDIRGTCVDMHANYAGGVGSSVLTRCGKDGINLRGPILVALDNVVTDAGRHGIFLKAAEPHFGGNTVTGSGRTGIFVSSGRYGPFDMTDNVSNDNGDYGMDVRYRLPTGSLSGLNTATGNGIANFRTKLGVE